MSDINGVSKQRDSRLELLRIIAAILILFHHVIQHSGESINSLTIALPSINQVISVVLGSYGQLGVAIFVIIGAWFSVDKSGDFKAIRTIRIIFQAWFTAVMILLIYAIIPGGGISKSVVIKELLTPLYTGSYWFVSVYVVYSFSIPLLQTVVNNLEINRLRLFVIVFTFFVPVYNFFGSNVGGLLADFCYLFILVAYLKRKPGNFFERHRYLVAICSLIIFWLLIETPIIVGSCIGSTTIMNYSLSISDSRNILIYILAISVFYIFQHLRVPHSTVINTIAKATLGTYLISENIIIRGDDGVSVIWNRYLRINDLYNSGWYGIVLIGLVLCVFILCVGVDLIRMNTVEKLLFTDSTTIKKLCKKLDVCLNGMFKN